ncbi:hypothetical protein HMPREF9120_02531, partial [Neisseria sp. oral taxon 020 str. F0370]
AVAFRAFFAGKIIAFAAVGVGKHGIEVVLFGGGGDAVSFVFEEFVAAGKTLIYAVGAVEHGTPDAAGGVGGLGQGAVVNRIFVNVFALSDGIIGGFDFDFEAVFLPIGDNIVGIDGFHGHRTADAAFHVAAEGGAFFDIDAADDVGVDIVAVVRARVAAPHGNRLLGAVHGYGDASLPLHAAYVGINGAAVARVAAVHADHAAEEVGYGVAFEGFDFFLAFVEVYHFAGVDAVAAGLVFVFVAF